MNDYKKWYQSCHLNNLFWSYILLIFNFDDFANIHNDSLRLLKYFSTFGFLFDPGKNEPRAC